MADDAPHAGGCKDKLTEDALEAGPGGRPACSRNQCPFASAVVQGHDTVLVEVGSLNGRNAAECLA